MRILYGFLNSPVNLKLKLSDRLSLRPCGVKDVQHKNNSFTYFYYLNKFMYAYAQLIYYITIYSARVALVFAFICYDWQLKINNFAGWLLDVWEGLILYFYKLFARSFWLLVIITKLLWLQREHHCISQSSAVNIFYYSFLQILFFV